MKRRKWTGQQKMQIVVAGLGNRRPLSELCAEHETLPF